MNGFVLNGYLWHVAFVAPDSSVLVDRTGEMRVATTDPSTLHVYLSDRLSGDFLIRVLFHELGHCVMFSYNLIADIHRMVKRQYWVEAEEWACNFIADYGLKIFSTAHAVLGDDAWILLPKQLSKLIG